MPRLVLIRHAKSGWDDPLLTDHQRPLAERGRGDAPRIGQWLAERNVLPEEVLCSDARRTQETWSLIAPYLGGVTPVLLPALYHAGPDIILDQLRKATGGTVVVVGHNPGIGEFAGLMLRKAPTHPDFERFPTSATLIADFPLDRWDKADYATASVEDFTVPRDL